MVMAVLGRFEVLLKQVMNGNGKRTAATQEQKQATSTGLLCYAPHYKLKLSITDLTLADETKHLIRKMVYAVTSFR